MKLIELKPDAKLEERVKICDGLLEEAKKVKLQGMLLFGVTEEGKFAFFGANMNAADSALASILCQDVSRQAFSTLKSEKL